MICDNGYRFSHMNINYKDCHSTLFILSLRVNILKINSYRYMYVTSCINFPFYLLISFPKDYLIKLSKLAYFSPLKCAIMCTLMDDCESFGTRGTSCYLCTSDANEGNLIYLNILPNVYIWYDHFSEGNFVKFSLSNETL